MLHFELFHHLNSHGFLLKNPRCGMLFAALKTFLVLTQYTFLRRNVYCCEICDKLMCKHRAFEPMDQSSHLTT